MRLEKAKGGAVTAVFRIRGQGPEAAVLSCEDWEHAIRKARRVLPHFEQRNPWFFLDSQQQKLYVLLDPDTETQTNASQPIRTQLKARSVTKKGAHSRTQ
jgi:hypothetical protein